VARGYRGGGGGGVDRRPPRGDEQVNEGSVESFPASDPPAY